MELSKQERVVFVTTLKELEELLPPDNTPRYSNYVKGLEDRGEIGILFDKHRKDPEGYAKVEYFKNASNRYVKLPHFTMPQLRIQLIKEKTAKLNQTTNLMQQDR